MPERHPSRRSRPVRRAVVPALALAPALLALAGCGGADEDAAPTGGATSGAAAVAVTATDAACTLSTATVAPGPVSLTVTNDGQQVTEVYVYDSADAVVAERENIGPGTQVSFGATLAAGSYQVACKPGMTGDGIRTPLTVR